MPPSTEIKGSIFCNLSNSEIFSTAQIDNIILALTFNSDESELKQELVNIRNDIVDKIKDIYEEAKLPPWIQFLKVNGHKLEKVNKMKLETILNGYQLKSFPNQLENFLQMDILKKKRERGLQLLDKARLNFISVFSQGNTDIKNDLTKKAQINNDTQSDLEKLYNYMIDNNLALFESLRDKIQCIFDHLEAEFLIDIKNFISKEINRGIQSILLQSKFNNKIGFFNSENSIDLDTIFNFMMTLGIENNRSNKYKNRYFFFQDKENYKKNQVNRII